MEHTWQATVDTFAAGIWVATILCAQAVAERVLAGILALQELPGRPGNPPKGWEGWGMGGLLRHVRERGWPPDDLLEELEAARACDFSARLSASGSNAMMLTVHAHVLAAASVPAHGSRAGVFE